MSSYFRDSGVEGALKKKLGLVLNKNDFNRLLEAAKSLPKQQVLHMDFVRGNVLFNGKELCGILDFEKTGYGNKLLDISRTLAFLLVDCKYKDEDKVTKYFLKSGYIKRGDSPFANYKFKKSDLLSELVNYFIYYDFYKFLRHNPYEDLHLNEHFIRTKEHLLKAGIITAV
jgi:thiamine kinase-like enzyme